MGLQIPLVSAWVGTPPSVPAGPSQALARCCLDPLGGAASAEPAGLAAAPRQLQLGFTAPKSNLSQAGARKRGGTHTAHRSTLAAQQPAVPRHTGWQPPSTEHRWLQAPPQAPGLQLTPAAPEAVSLPARPTSNRPLDPESTEQMPQHNLRPQRWAPPVLLQALQPQNPSSLICSCHGYMGCVKLTSRSPNLSLHMALCPGLASGTGSSSPSMANPATSTGSAQPQGRHRHCRRSNPTERKGAGEGGEKRRGVVKIRSAFGEPCRTPAQTACAYLSTSDRLPRNTAQRPGPYFFLDRESAA